MSMYSDAVLLDNPLHYWRMKELAGNAADDKGGLPVTLHNVTHGTVGPLLHDDEGAITFDGSTSFGQVLLDLTAHSTLTVEFWLDWTAFANNDDLALEFTRNFNDVAGGFLVDPNDGNNLGVGAGISRGTGRNASFTAAPSAGAWHHYAFLFDTHAASGKQVLIFIDGVEGAIVKGGATGVSEENFADETLNVMCRNGEALFGQGSMAHLAIYGGLLTPEKIKAHVDAASAEEEPEPEPEPEPEEESRFIDARIGWLPEIDTKYFRNRTYKEGK